MAIKDSASDASTPVSFRRRVRVVVIWGASPWSVSDAGKTLLHSAFTVLSALDSARCLPKSFCDGQLLLPSTRGRKALADGEDDDVSTCSHFSQESRGGGSGRGSVSRDGDDARWS